ncbi:tRNA-dihydrouridine synthase family protein [Candidatus Pacearchaeota archaeon]|nr:tRNA-dihydrouridine synthase family protein [Candidatus Pacearchaeota archaeon]
MELHLAPLENVSCWAFRSLYTGASDSYTGMLSLTNLTKRATTWEEVDTFPIEGQRQWIQIATAKETECATFLTKLEEELQKHPEKDTIYGIQLNCSCPSPQLIRLGQGPALIKRTTKVGKLLRELLKQTKYKIGIKVRLGLNEYEVAQRKIITLCRELEKLAHENANFTNVTIHFKHAQEPSSKAYSYSLLNEIASFKIPLIINGGITNEKDIQRVLAHIEPANRKNIKGIMIGREAMKNPNCFLEMNQEAKSQNQETRIIKNEFKALCAQHQPKQIYLTTIAEKTKPGLFL